MEGQQKAILKKRMEKAIRILVDAQRKCEELYINTPDLEMQPPVHNAECPDN